MSFITAAVVSPASVLNLPSKVASTPVGDKNEPTVATKPQSTDIDGSSKLLASSQAAVQGKDFVELSPTALAKIRSGNTVSPTPISPFASAASNTPTVDRADLTASGNGAAKTFEMPRYSGPAGEFGQWKSRILRMLNLLNQGSNQQPNRSAGASHGNHKTLSSFPTYTPNGPSARIDATAAPTDTGAISASLRESIIDQLDAFLTLNDQLTPPTSSLVQFTPKVTLDLIAD